MDQPVTRITQDWYDGAIPENVVFEADVYLDTSYGFAPFLSSRRPGLLMGNASGAYDRTTFVVGPNGHVNVGSYTCLNGTYLVCNDSITIGAHCLIAWGVTITDTWLRHGVSVDARRLSLRAAAADPDRQIPPVVPPQPVVVEDAVWVGFDSVVLPGVTLGRGCVVGCRTIVDRDVPPNAVVVGNPMRVIRYLESIGEEEVRSIAWPEPSGE